MESVLQSREDWRERRRPTRHLHGLDYFKRLADGHLLGEGHSISSIDGVWVVIKGIGGSSEGLVLLELEGMLVLVVGMLLVMVHDMGLGMGAGAGSGDSDGRSCGSCVSFATGLGRSRERRKERRKRKADKKGEKKQAQSSQTRGWRPKLSCNNSSSPSHTRPFGVNACHTIYYFILCFCTTMASHSIVFVFSAPPVAIPRLFSQVKTLHSKRVAVCRLFPVAASPTLLSVAPAPAVPRIAISVPVLSPWPAEPLSPVLVLVLVVASVSLPAAVVRVFPRWLIRRAVSTPARPFISPVRRSLRLVRFLVMASVVSVFARGLLLGSLVSPFLVPPPRTVIGVVICTRIGPSVIIGTCNVYTISPFSSCRHCD